MKILLLGTSGQVGRELARTLQGLGTLVTASRVGGDYCVDLFDHASMQHVLGSTTPEVIVNAAAYTAVDKAEQEREKANAINRDAVALLADYCRKADVHLVHYSTDYVFPGTATSPLTEDAPVTPINAYGASKLGGEEAIRSSGCSHFILRTAWVYGVHGHNFLRSMLRLAAQRDELQIVADQAGAPTWSRMLAQLTALALHKAGTRERLAACSGTYHVSAQGQTTWHEFATEIFRLAHSHELLERQPNVRPITTAEFPTPATRPAYSVLSNERFGSTFNLQVPHWKTQLRLCVEDIANQGL